MAEEFTNNVICIGIDNARFKNKIMKELLSKKFISKDKFKSNRLPDTEYPCIEFTRCNFKVPIVYTYDDVNNCIIGNIVEDGYMSYLTNNMAYDYLERIVWHIQHDIGFKHVTMCAVSCYDVIIDGKKQDNNHKQWTVYKYDRENSKKGIGYFKLGYDCIPDYASIFNTSIESFEQCDETYLESIAIVHDYSYYQLTESIGVRTEFNQVGENNFELVVYIPSSMRNISFNTRFEMIDE